MRHQEAQRLLPDLRTGELPRARRVELEAHLERCDECRGWSETYGFLAQALAAGYEEEHPSSEQIARLAVDAELLTAAERQRITAHVEECADCRRELGLSREALAGAVGAESALRFPRRPPSRTLTLRLALAASLILAVAAVFLVGHQNRAERGPAVAVLAPVPETAEPTPSAATGGTGAGAEGVAEPAADSTVEAPAAEAPPAATRPAAIAAPAVAVADPPLEAPPVVTANYAIHNGAVRLRAGEMVVLGDGFSVGASASLDVEVPRTAKAGP